MRLFGIDAGMFLFVIVVAAVFAVVTARIGVKKGYSRAGFCALGFFLGIIGLVIALVVPSKAAQDAEMADSLLKYKRLLDEGIITPAEFEQKKSELLSTGR